MTATVVFYLLDQLAGAITRHDGDAAVDILRQLHTVAPQATDRLISDLITTGLTRATQPPQGGQQ